MAQPLLSDGNQEYVDSGLSNAELSARVESLNERIEELEARIEQTKRLKQEAVVALLNLLSQSLKHVASGKFDLEEITSDAAPSKWEAIKKRLPPRQAEAIDIFLAQGALKRTQLAAAMRMDYSNCTKNVIAVLIRQGLLIESGGQLSLKQL